MLNCQGCFDKGCDAAVPVTVLPGELTLIVIGVLLALSVDEWRQARARQIAGEEALRSTSTS